MNNYYQLLEIKHNATTKEIKRAYHTLALKYHPDKNKEKCKSTERFKLLSEAYTILSNPKKRFQYDIQLFFGLNTEIIQLSDSDLEIIHHYYLKIIQSSEYKLLLSLYSSLPKVFKKKVYEKFTKKQINSTILIDIGSIRYIDISQVISDYTLNLVLKLRDIYELKSHEIIVLNREKNMYYYLLITEPVVYFLNNHPFFLKLNIEIENNENYLISNYDLHYHHSYNLYQYYFVNNYFLSLPNTNTIIFNLKQHMIHKKGLYNPKTRERGDLYLNHRLNLEIKNKEKYKETLFTIFNH